MTKYVGKMLLLNSKRLLRKLQKILGVTFLPHPVYLKLQATSQLFHYGSMGQWQRAFDP